MEASPPQIIPVNLLNILTQAINSQTLSTRLPTPDEGHDDDYDDDDEDDGVLVLVVMVFWDSLQDGFILQSCSWASMWWCATIGRGCSEQSMSICF